MRLGAGQSVVRDQLEAVSSAGYKIHSGEPAGDGTSSAPKTAGDARQYIPREIRGCDFPDVLFLVDARQLLLLPPDILALIVALGVRRRELRLPYMQNIPTHGEALRNLLNRLGAMRYLTRGVALKILAEIRFAHHCLPASKLGKKASKNLWAIPSVAGGN